MSLKDAVKSIEEADEKLIKAAALEQKAIAAQRDAARLREESERNLEKLRHERATFEKIQGERESASAQKEQELKNRETKLSAGQADLERRTAESIDARDARNNELVLRGVSIEKREQSVKEQGEALSKVGEKYKSIADFINANL